MRNVIFGTTSRYSDRDSFGRISSSTFKKSAVAALLGGVALAMLAGTANAATSNGAINVGANVQSGCQVIGGSIGFGSINPISGSGPLNVQWSFAVKCTSMTPYWVSLDAGLNSGTTANVNTRKMKNTSTSDTLAYQIYLDSAHTNVWGTTMASSSGGMGTGSSQNLNLYAQLPDGSMAVPGTYGDTVMVTITY